MIIAFTSLNRNHFCVENVDCSLTQVLDVLFNKVVDFEKLTRLGVGGFLKFISN